MQKWLMVLSLFLTAALPLAAQESGATSAPDREALEKKLEQQLTGATLAGKFSVDGRNDSKPERYEISSAEKLKGDDWVITSRIKYGDKDVSIPIVVKMYWAGSTPVLTLDDLTIPGLGTFTARVMFHGDRYTGTWQHGDHGGHLWGKIESSKDSKKDEGKTPAEKSPPQK